VPSRWHSSRINCASLISFDCAIVFSASSAETVRRQFPFGHRPSRSTFAGSACSVLTTTPIAVGRSSLAVLRSQIIDSSYGAVLNAGSHGLQLQLGGILDAPASDRLFPFDGAEGRLPCCRLLAWCSSNHLDLLLFRLLGFPIAFLLAFCHVDSLEV
jgi:hypothetical protein